MSFRKRALEKEENYDANIDGPTYQNDTTNIKIIEEKLNMVELF